MNGIEKVARELIDEQMEHHPRVASWQSAPFRLLTAIKAHDKAAASACNSVKCNCPPCKEKRGGFYSHQRDYENLALGRPFVGGHGTLMHGQSSNPRLVSLMKSQNVGKTEMMSIQYGEIDRAVRHANVDLKRTMIEQLERFEPQMTEYRKRLTLGVLRGYAASLRKGPDALTAAEHKHRFELLLERPSTRHEPSDWRPYMRFMIKHLETDKYMSFREWKVVQAAALAEKQRVKAAADETHRALKHIGLPPPPPGSEWKAVTWHTNAPLRGERTMRVDLVAQPLAPNVMLGTASDNWPYIKWIDPVRDRVRPLSSIKLKWRLDETHIAKNLAADIAKFTEYNMKDVDMTMSKDRIEFNLYAADSEKDGTVRAASRAFGFSYPEARGYLVSGRRIRCRPSQFGRFIVFRIEEGVMNNQIKLLNPAMVADTVETVDVSKRSFD